MFAYVVYCKSSQPCIHKSDIYLMDMEKLKNINPRCTSNKLVFNLFNSFLCWSYNNVRTKFVKLIAIYQLFILQFTVTIAQVNSITENNDGILTNIQQEVMKKAEEFWELIKKCLYKICSPLGLQCTGTCDKPYVAIPVTVFLFVLVFSIICFIFCKRCCKKSCCKKKENDESDVDYNNFIVGPDGQMCSTMYQGEMMQPETFSAGMMYPQTYQGQMFYPQMLQEGMQQPVTQEPGKKRKKKKRSSKHKNTNDDALLVGYDMM